MPACAARPCTIDLEVVRAGGAREHHADGVAVEDEAAPRAHALQVEVPRAEQAELLADREHDVDRRMAEPALAAGAHALASRSRCPDLSSPPSTVVPSVRITSPSTIGFTPTPGSTVSMWAQSSSGGASAVPGHVRDQVARPRRRRASPASSNSHLGAERAQLAREPLGDPTLALARGCRSARARADRRASGPPGSCAGHSVRPSPSTRLSRQTGRIVRRRGGEPSGRRRRRPGLGLRWAPGARRAGAVTLLGRRRAPGRPSRATGCASRGSSATHRGPRSSDCVTIRRALDGPLGAVLLTVKSYDTAAMAARGRAASRARRVLVSLQNGLGNVEAAARAVGARARPRRARHLRRRAARGRDACA